jgi:regulator of replication initiation timing
MKKYIITLALSFLLLSCNDKEVVQKPIQEEVVLDYQDPKKVDSLLEMVDGFKISVDEVIYEKQTLKVDNKKLNKELVLVKDELTMVKDCLEVANDKIKEYKFPKKRSFFDKVLGTNKDSITVIDTIK